MNSLELYKKTVGELQKSGIKSAEIDAQILLEFAARKSREFLLVNQEYQLKNRKIEELKKLSERRKKHEPIAYITGHKEFFGLDFFVDKNVLIPRPETEQLVEIALDFLNKKDNKTAAVLDVGTGSGNIIISLAKNASGVFFASDNSAKALEVAKKNVAIHNVEINFIQSDLFENILGKFDLIIANLPYVPIDGSFDKEIKFEPENAIFAKDNGTMIIKRFLIDAKKPINSGGLILVELDPRNADEILVFAKQLYNSAEIISDFSDQKRILKVLT